MKITYPETGWFYITINGYVGRVSYLDFPFHDLANIAFNAYEYSAPGSLVMDAEGYDNIFVYDHHDQTFSLWNTETGEKFAEKFTREQILKEVLPAFGLLALYLYFGPNIVEFTTSICEIDYNLTPEQCENRELLTYEIHNHDKKSKDYFRNALRAAINVVSSILNVTHNIACFSEHEKWYDAHIVSLRTYLDSVGVNVTDKDAVSGSLKDVILGNVKPEMNIISFLGFYAVFSIYSFSKDIEKRNAEFDKIVSSIIGGGTLTTEEQILISINEHSMSNQFLGKMNIEGINTCS